MHSALTSKPLLMSGALALILGGVGTYAWHMEHRPSLFEVYVFLVKGAQAYFVRTPEDHRILIDGGGSTEIVKKVSSVLPFYSRRIDTLILTRPDAAFATGLVGIVDRYDVGRIVVPALTLQSIGLSSTTDPAYETLLAHAEERGIQIHEAQSGDEIEIGTTTQASVLFPVPSSVFDYSRASGPRLIVQFAYRNTSVLILGDATKKIQDAVVRSVPAPVFPSATTHALIWSVAADPAHLSGQLTRALSPRFVIYKKAVSRSSSVPAPSSRQKSSNSKKSSARQPEDPLAGIPASARLNLNETGDLYLASDGIQLTVQPFK